jgi:hypothetical protein
VALLWLKTHNPLYRDIILNEECLNDFPTNDVLPVHIEVVNKADAVEVLTSHYDAPHTKTIFDSLVVTDLDGNATVNQLRAAAMKHMKAKAGGFLQIPHADRLANEFYSPELLLLTYPSLFPYGVGGFSAEQLNISFH